MREERGAMRREGYMIVRMRMRDCDDGGDER